MHVFLTLVFLIGWCLGIIGYFHARRLREEIADLRRQLAQRTPRGAYDSPNAPLPQAPPQLAATAAPAPEPESPWAPRPEQIAPPVDIEALLTMRWGVWLGAAALLFAGVFLVRYAVDQGYLGPAARCAVAALLGAAFLAGAEWLQRHAVPVQAGPFRTDQAPPGLAAGGVAILFGAAYGAGPYYGLLPPLLAFASLAAASCIGLAASLRFGQLTAAIGIAGAFVTPALVATEAPSLPGLFAYLFAVSAAALYVVRRMAWTWLGWAAAFAGAAWVCLAATGAEAGNWAAALFVPAAALLHLALLPAGALNWRVGRRLAWVPFAALAASGLVLECAAGGDVNRYALLLLGPVAVWKGVREPALDRLPWLAAVAGLLTLLLWDLPAWVPSAEYTGLEGFIQALLPGTWHPEVIRPLMIAASLLAAFNAAAGLVLERSAPAPLRWAALGTATPVLTLAVAYAQVRQFQTDAGWATLAVVLAGVLAGTATRARGAIAGVAGTRQAGVHAASSVAAVALACAMLLQDQWLTFSIALLVPALAVLAVRAALPELRWPALALAALVLVRLLLNRDVLLYHLGSTLALNGLLAAYAAPAASFALASILFRRTADDLVVTVLEGGAVALAATFVALEIRHGFGGGHLGAAASFPEFALQFMALAAQATCLLYLDARIPRPVLQPAGWGIGAFCLALGGGLILLSPAVTNAPAGAWSLAAAYLVPAALAAVATRLVHTQEDRHAVALYAVISGFAWITLQIRAGFHPHAIGFAAAPVRDAELWAWSGAWLLYGSALMLLGIRTADRMLRIIALAVIGLVCAKVFLIDMSDLTGLWRVCSFLGLGLALIGLGAVHRRLVLGTK